MATLHILTARPPIYVVVSHIPIPAANNAAGISYRTAVINSKLGGTTILPDGDGTAGTISAAEKALILSGAVVEIIDNLDITQAGATGVQIGTFIDAHFATRTTQVQNDLQAQLAHFGRTR